MSTEYGLITKELTEKQILKILNDKLKTFFREMADKEFDVYKNYNLSKMKNHGGLSDNPNYIPWDYEYLYYLGHKYYGLSLELYPNTNDEGGQKFKNEGVIWNLAIIEHDWYIRNLKEIKKKNPDIKRFVEFFLQDLPFEVVVLYEYADGEERI